MPIALWIRPPNFIALFYEAVRIRAGDDIRSYSFLSGGMDSRAIVATLIKMGRHVESLNFSSSGSQDQYYAQQFAETTTSQCRLNYYSGGVFPNFSFLALAAKANLERGEHTPVDRPQLIWSGDGGSVGLGHVYMDERMLEFGDKGDIEGMVKHFFRRKRTSASTRHSHSTCSKEAAPNAAEKRLGRG
ncbi:asparagine synthase-related protein [Candidatus Accumulibacter phosphatis]|uniref:asparagine synthase-related protein n=1 Tax=Candidatus Accumulibacter phosphatis TaxID=327160 RepID=UPI00145F171D|nr:asparagine synthase-related protein [Candidatus Accumulibacter phosphatis]